MQKLEAPKNDDKLTQKQTTSASTRQEWPFPACTDERDQRAPKYENKDKNPTAFNESDVSGSFLSTKDNANVERIVERILQALERNLLRFCATKCCHFYE